MATVYWVGFYAKGKRMISDGIGPFLTKDEALDAAWDELARVACIPLDKRDPGMDWAVRFTVSKGTWPDRMLGSIKSTVRVAE